MSENSQIAAMREKSRPHTITISVRFASEKEVTEATVAAHVAAIHAVSPGVEIWTKQSDELTPGAPAQQGVTKAEPRSSGFKNKVLRRIREVAIGYAKGGHTHRARMLEALATEFEQYKLEAAPALPVSEGLPTSARLMHQPEVRDSVHTEDKNCIHRGCTEIESHGVTFLNPPLSEEEVERAKELKASTKAGPRCPKCGSANIHFYVPADNVHCFDCKADFSYESLSDFAQFFPSPEQGKQQHSVTYGELPESVRGMIQPHEWDNKNISEQRDWLMWRLNESLKDATSWKSHWKMYRDAWVRELGGWLLPKHHEIDALVLTTRRRCVNPILGNCAAPHWLGKPTEDRSALQQTPHPENNGCKGWKPQIKADASPEQGWIKVEDRLPEVGETVIGLVCGECPCLIEMEYPVSVPWLIEPIKHGHKITHWQPFPAPPRPSTEEGK